LRFTFVYNLPAVDVISPVIASVTMATRCLLVMGNSLRLRV